ncbi:hypothetical protein Tco_1221846, partial [Tanacetum coccineum]
AIENPVDAVNYTGTVLDGSNVDLSHLCLGGLILASVLLNNRVQALYLIILQENSSAHQVVRHNKEVSMLQLLRTKRLLHRVWFPTNLCKTNFTFLRWSLLILQNFLSRHQGLYVHSTTSYGVKTNDHKSMIEGYPQKTIFQSAEEGGHTF